jgi:hypothetical protein
MLVTSGLVRHCGIVRRLSPRTPHRHRRLRRASRRRDRRAGGVVGMAHGALTFQPARTRR